MISFPVTPAPAGLPGAPAGAAPPPDGAAQFLELLKQMTANAGVAPTPLAANAKPAVPVSVPLPIVDAAVTSLQAGRARTTSVPGVDDAPVADQKAAVDDTAQTNTDAVIVPVAVAPAPLPPAATLTATLSAPKTVTDTPDRSALQALAAAQDAPETPELPAKNAVAAPATPELPAGPKFNVAAQTPAHAAAASDASDADTAAAAALSASGAPASSTPASASTNDAFQPVPSAKTSAAAAARDAAAAPVAATTASIQNAPAGAGTSKRDSNAGTSDRRGLDAMAPYAAAPAAQSSAPVFQLAADVRPLLSNGQIGAVISSSALPNGTLTVRDTADLPQQIVQAMRFQLNNAGGGDAHIKLQPEYLGDLTISIRVERGDVNATLSASAPEVRQWIESHEPLLRQMLSDRGLQLSEFVVNDERQSNSRDEESQSREEREPQPQSRRRAAQGATFEVLA